jgi:hypothetical protein
LIWVRVCVAVIGTESGRSIGERRLALVPFPSKVVDELMVVVDAEDG